MQDPINVVLAVAVTMAAILGVAAFHSQQALDWLILRLLARRAALRAYQDEYRKVISAGRFGYEFAGFAIAKDREYRHDQGDARTGMVRERNSHEDAQRVVSRGPVVL